MNGEGKMIIRRGEERSLLSWLTTQEKVLALWIDEVLSAAPQNTDFVGRLETHHKWIAHQIDLLTHKEVA